MLSLVFINRNYMLGFQLTEEGKLAIWSLIVPDHGSNCYCKFKLVFDTNFAILISSWHLVKFTCHLNGLEHAQAYSSMHVYVFTHSEGTKS